MSIKIKVIAICLFSFLNFSCNTTDPPDNQIIKLTVEDVSCTEAWLKLETENLDLPAQINLYADDKLKSNYTLSSNDTTLYVDSLLPNRNYNFHSTIHPINQAEIKSNELSVTTLDTTSHNFTWQTFTFGGEAGSCTLFDVAIINENSIWAVGEIYLKDSLGNYDPHAYNAVHWNGEKWELKKIYFPTVCGQSSLTSYPAKAIFAFEDGQIWISSSGDKIAVLKDGTQIDKFCLPSNVAMSINKLWGTSSDDLYAVGNNGNIAHYQNGVWTRIVSGTDLNINDIWGEYNSTTKQYEILCAASNILESPDREILKIKCKRSPNFGQRRKRWNIKQCLV